MRGSICVIYVICILAGAVLGQDSILIKKEQAALLKAKISESRLKELTNKKIYEFSNIDVDDYLRYYSNFEPNLRKRIEHYGMRFIGQPCKIYLLGEAPFELYDPDPLVSIQNSDCVTYVEMVYAMGLSDNWRSFMCMLQISAP